ncbi:GNAT family N-acetyltransferase [Saccharicrinis sp. FJH62]|uniref:GNAT family N-acetyltransferase n=1 Tax=Saccharicrinis sp. FJH62 TaxID=3344657 RepID=UPI0035D4B8DE
MAVIIKEVNSTKLIKDFVNFQYKLYRNDPYWVPPMKKDEEKALSPETNPAMEFAVSKFWVAYRDNKAVGRIGGIIIPARNEKTGEKIARFTRPEFIDDEEVADKLFETFTEWAKSQGMQTLMGPLGFSNLDHQGLLIEGHEWLPAVASDYHFAYYKKHYDRLGFEKEIDWLEFRITFPEALPEKSFRVADLLRDRFKLRSLEFESKKELDPYKEQIFQLFNKAFTELFGTYELPEKVITFYIDKYYPILLPQYVKLVVDENDKMIGFLIALPSLSKAMQKAGGKLFPFGWYHIMQAFKNPDEMDLMLTGVVPEFQKRGVAALMMNDLWKTANKAGIKYVETTAMLENNFVAIQMWKSFDHIQHKRKRCFKKDI